MPILKRWNSSTGQWEVVVGADAAHLSAYAHEDIAHTNRAALDVVAGTNTGDETTTTLGAKLNSATEKTTPVDADMLGLMDSSAGNVLKKFSWASLKTAIKSYYDSVTSTFTNKSIALSGNTLTGTKAQFNAAMTDADFVTLDGTETLTNKTLTSPSFNGTPYTSYLRVGGTAAYSWNGATGLDVSTRGALAGTGSDVSLVYNLYYDTTNFKYKASEAANQLYMTQLGLYFRTLAAGNAGDTIGTWKNIFGIGLSGYNCSVFGTNTLIDTVNALQVLGGMAVQGALEDNQTIGNAAAARIKIINTYSAAYGRLAELQFSAAGSAANQITACISSAYRGYNASNGLGGDLLFSTKYASTDTVPLERMRITPLGNILMGTTAEDTSYKLLVNGSVKFNYSAGSTYGIALDGTTKILTGATCFVGITIPTPVILDASASYIGMWSQVKPLVPAGVTNGNYAYGCATNALRNYVAADSDDGGTLATLVGQSIVVGHGNTNTSAVPLTTTVKGINVKPYAYYGTITHFYGMYIDGPAGSGTITNKWGIYQNDSAFRNYFNGSVLIGTNTEVTAYKVYAIGSKTDASSYGITGAGVMTLTTGGGYNVVGVYGQATGIAIPAGVTASGFSAGILARGYADTTNFAGTLQNSIGVKAETGINSCTSGAVVANAYGAMLTVVNASGGTITNAFACYADNSTVTGTITNRWGFYQVGASARNYFQGNSLFGTTSENTTTGNAKVQSSNGIYLGNSANSAANVLDWYEEGTWTPSVIGASTAGVATYTNQVGTYTRIGREVHFRCTVGWSAHTGSGGLRISGLPFTSSSTTNTQSTGSVYFDGLTVGAGKTITAYISTNNTVITVKACDPAGGAVDELNAGTLDTSVALLIISGSYMV